MLLLAVVVLAIGLLFFACGGRTSVLEPEWTGMDRILALVLTLAVGALIAFQPPANAALARHVGDLGATFTSLLIATALASIVLVVAGDPGELRGLQASSPEYLLGPISGAAIIFVTILTVGPLGATGVAAAVVTTQLAASALIDHFALLDVERTELSVVRLSGVALLVIGTVLVTSR